MLEPVFIIASTAFAGLVTAAAGVLIPWLQRSVSKFFGLPDMAAEVEQIAAEARRHVRDTLDSVQEIIAQLSLSGDRDSSLPEIKKALRELTTLITNRDQPSPAVEGLITGYHKQALSQAQAQFWFSCVAATVGSRGLYTQDLLLLETTSAQHSEPAPE